MNAFGPFKDKVIIDFEKDKINNGLLLISGDTGAGKTTVFDAICFALYGQTSGEFRSVGSLKSDFALPEVEPYVILEFYYKNKYYEVKRVPEYTRPNMRGPGEVKQSQKAEFEINGIKLTKVQDVNNKLAELIGLDYNQFKQVALLSQGEFTKFLLASSPEKTTIFRKIFGTEIYDQVQSELKANEKSKKDELDKVIDKIDTVKKNLKDIINLFGLSDDETISALNNQIKEDEEAVSKAKKERDEKNEEQTKLSNELKNLNDLNEKIKKFNEASENLEKLLSDNPDIEEEKEKYNYNIEVAMPIFKVLDRLNNESESLGSKKTECLKNKECLEIKENEYKEKEVEFKKLENYPAEADKRNNEINELEKKGELYGNYLTKEEELAEAQIECKKKSEEYEKQNALYGAMRNEYYLNASVEIAETLEDGKPCPVCGSIDHPQKAISVESNCTKEDLEKEEEKTKELDGQRKKFELRIEQIRKTIKDYDIPEGLDVELEKDENAKLLQEKKEEKEKFDKEFNELRELKEGLDSEITGYKTKIETFSGEIKELEESIKENNLQLERLYKENNTNEEDYMSKKLDENALAELKLKLEDFNKKKTGFESTIELLKEEVKDKEITDVSEKEEQLAQVNNEFEELDKLYTDLSSTLDQLKTSNEHILEYMEGSKVIQEEYKIIKVLSDTANGSLSGKQKITFENYVQAYFMETVLVEANKRFFKMTDGIYELKKKEIDIKKTGKTGLDFSVFDFSTGKERDVSSLSGGEKFKASLALALGLSDVISNKSGGIKLESLFIDEGFGSLDSESLNQALNILYDLSGNDKLIGVISHVAELKTRIDNKILVNKTNAGSGINIETNF